MCHFNDNRLRNTVVIGLTVKNILSFFAYLLDFTKGLCIIESGVCIEI